MTEFEVAEMVARVKEHEGYRRFPYLDTVGVLTVGYGRNLKHVGIDADEAEYLVRRDLRRAEMRAATIVPGFDALDGTRQGVFVELVFNLGSVGLSKFTRMLAAVARRDWPAAAAELLDSTWAKQVGPTRSGRIHALILGTTYPADATRRA